MINLDEIKIALNDLPLVKDIEFLIKEGKYKSHDQIAEAITNNLNSLAEYIHDEGDKEHGEMELINQSGVVNILKEKGYTVVLEEENGDYSIGVDW